MARFGISGLHRQTDKVGRSKVTRNYLTSLIAPSFASPGRKRVREIECALDFANIRHRLQLLTRISTNACGAEPIFRPGFWRNSTPRDPQLLTVSRLMPRSI